jgi:glycosyltransferase involved in cell wall biosynthesis
MVQAGTFDPLVIINDWSAILPIETMEAGRRTVHLRLSAPVTDGWAILGLLKWVLLLPASMYAIFLLSRRYRLRVVNFHYVGLSVLPVALSRMLGIFRGVVILSFHGLDLADARASGRFPHLLWRFVFRHATALVGCSNALAAELCEFAGGQASRVSAIQNGIDVDSFLATVQTEAQLPAMVQDRRIVLCVATWEHKKGIDVLIGAFAALRENIPDLVLVLIGRSGGTEPQLRAITRELNIEESVVFCENLPHPQVGAYLAHATVFCLPSRAEPFGIAILEAGVYRLPVIASRVGGVPEIISDEETGLLVPPDDQPALTAALRRLLSDNSFARGLGASLHERVLKDFTWKRAYYDYMEVVRAGQ